MAQGPGARDNFGDKSGRDDGSQALPGLDRTVEGARDALEAAQAAVSCGTYSSGVFLNYELLMRN